MTSARIETDPEILRSFLSDAAHVPGGFTTGIAFPQSAAEVASVVSSASTVLPIGAQSSLTGGATPRGEVVLNTRALTDVVIDHERGLVRVGAGVPISVLQATLATRGLWYPPVPTYDGAFIGGTVATNAAGAATFKYGTTRQWVSGVSVILAGGQRLSIDRGAVLAGPHGFAIDVDGEVLRVPVPRYTMPDVPKLSAGYFAQPGMDLVDLFVGSEGTLGVIVEVTLRVIARPPRMVVLIPCANEPQAIGLTRALRERARRAWRGEGVLDVSAIEYMDAKGLALVPETVAFAAGIGRQAGDDSLLLVQIEAHDDTDPVVEELASVLAANGVVSDPVVAEPANESGARKLFELREAVPAAVNAAVAVGKQADPEIQKTAGDFIVPFDRLGDSLALYRNVFESRGLDYAVWGHASDGNLHPNAIPRSREDMLRALEALLEAARAVIAMGGSPLAEHGVGRSPLKQQLLGELYGEQGIDDMRAVKRALDPTWKLAPGVLFREHRG